MKIIVMNIQKDRYSISLLAAGTQVEKGTTVQYMVSKGSQPSDPDSGNSGNDSGTEENTNQ